MPDKNIKRIAKLALKSEHELEQDFVNVQKCHSMSSKYGKLIVLSLYSWAFWLPIYFYCVENFNFMNLGWALLFPFAAHAILCFGVKVITGDLRSSLYELTPISQEAKVCRDCLWLVENDVDAKAWRDKVLENNRQLRVFDHTMMVNLYIPNRDAAERVQTLELLEKEAAENKMACAALHKLGT